MFRKLFQKKYYYVVLFLMVIGLSKLLFAEVPQRINYQGRLLDNGNPVNDSKSMTFKIYDGPTAGTKLWEETQGSVNVSSGIFNVLLGTVTVIPSSVFVSTGSNNRYLEIIVAGETMSPRQQMVSVPYAYEAEIASRAAGNFSVARNLYGSTASFSGNVGIGDANPSYKLSVDGNVYSTGYYQSRKGGSDSYPGNGSSITFGHSGGNYCGLQLSSSGTMITTPHFGYHDLDFWTSGGGGWGSKPKMRITGYDGNVSIGNTDAFFSKLSITGFSAWNQILFISTDTNMSCTTFGIDNTGLVYISSCVKAECGFIDGTPYPKTKEQAYNSVLSMKLNTDGSGIDHAQLDNFIKYSTTRKVFNKITKEMDTVIEEGRNLSATVSAQNEVIKDLMQRNQTLENKIVNFENRIQALESR